MQIKEIHEDILKESSWNGLVGITITKSEDIKDDKNIDDIINQIIELKNGIVGFYNFYHDAEILEIIKKLRTEDPDRKYHFLLYITDNFNVEHFKQESFKFKLDSYIIYFIENISQETKMDNIAFLNDFDEIIFKCTTKENFEVIKKIMNEIDLPNATIVPQNADWVKEEIIKEKLRVRYLE